MAVPASAADVTIALSQQTGNGVKYPFDAQDPDADNNIVRTLDEVIYSVSVGSVADPVTTPTVTIAFPPGQEMAALPTDCLPGSSLSPGSPPPDYINITSASYASLAAQTLVCILPDLPASESVAYEFTTTIRPEVPNGVTLGPVEAVISSADVVGDVTSNAVSQVVSAIPKWDVSINGSTASENTAFIKQATVQRCSDLPGIPLLPDGSRQMCYVGGYPVTVSIPGRVGGSPMAGGDFSLEIATDPVTIWGQDAVDAIAAYNLDNGTSISLSGGYLGSIVDSPFESPFSRVSAGTTTNSVRESGTTISTQSNGGDPVLLTVNAADTSGYTFPTQAGAPAGYSIRDDRGYVYTQRVFIEVPLGEVMANQSGLDNLPSFDLDPAAGSFRMPIRVTADESNLNYSTVAGLVAPAMADTNQFSDADGTANNYRRANATLRDWQPVSNHWASPPGYPTATTPAVHAPGYPAWWGPSGPAGIHTGDGVAVTGQTVLSTVTLEGDVSNGTSTLVCQAFDNSTVVVDNSAAVATGNGTSQQGNGSTRFPAYSDVDQGGVTWISGSMVNFMEATSVTTEGTAPGQTGMADRFGAFEVQYGVGAVEDSTCEQPIDWYDSLTAVPGGAGVVNKVRFVLRNRAGWNAITQRTSVSIAMRTIATDPGTVIPTSTNYVQVVGWNSDLATMAAIPASSWVRSNYDHTLDAFQTSYDDTPGVGGRAGDMLTLVDSVVNLDKTVQSSAGVTLDNYNWVPAYSTSTDPAYPEWARSVTDEVPLLAAGTTVEFELTPVVSANPALTATDPRRIQDVIVEDCLPAETTPDSAATTPWTFSQADLDSGALPYTAGITCDAGETYLAWYFDDRDLVNDPIPPIQVVGNILVTAPSGELMNDAVITVADPASGLSSVPSNVDQRTGRVLFDVQGSDSLVISKSVSDPLIYVDSAGWVSSPSSTWRLVVANFDSSTVLTDVDLIDFLPVNGVNSSNFATGTTTLQAVVQDPPQAGEIGHDNVTILYTAATINDADFAAMSDPGNASYNSATGSTGWCAYDGSSFASVSGTGACPADMSGVTGIRVQRPGEFPHDGVIRVSMQTDASGNIDADAVRNTAVARISGINVPIQDTSEVTYQYRDWPNNVGSIAGSVWDDLDSDGVWAASEVPIEGVQVSLLDSSGNAVLDAAGDPVTVLTDGNGDYVITGLAAGDYTVVFTTPDRMFPTIAGLDSLGSSVAVTLSTTDQDVTGVDSGFRAPGDLDLDKSVMGASGALLNSVQYANVGDTLTYTIEAINGSPDRPFTGFFPARLIDDLSDVLDGATYVDGSLSASQGTVTLTENQLVWYGPLGVGQSVSITYQVIVTRADTATNVAFVSDPPVDPETGMPEGPNGPIIPADPADPGVTDPTPTERIDPPTSCDTPDCATTSTPVAGGTPAIPVLSTTGVAVGLGAVLAAVLLMLVGSAMLLSRSRRLLQS
ncbi:MAG: SdrD B-like domain-containing protein [Beutenbergiaceae bacterium]